MDDKEGTFDGGLSPEEKALRILEYVGTGNREAGKARQLVTVVASTKAGPRDTALRGVMLPSIVVHGISDKLVCTSVCVCVCVCVCVYPV